MINLNNITLISIDGTGSNTTKLKNIFNICSKNINFVNRVLITADKTCILDDIKVSHIDKMSYQEYNKFCILELTKFVETEYILLIQNDGFISTPDLWDNAFLNYDYIGAPWEHEDVPNPFPWTSNGTKNMVGCGGFSLRSKKLLNLCSKYDSIFVENQIKAGMNEDIFICVYARPQLEAQGCKFPDVKIANKFSKGSIPFKPGVTDTSFGFHNGGYIEECLSTFNNKYQTNYNIGDIL